MEKNPYIPKLIRGNSMYAIRKLIEKGIKVDFTFLDPPFNQNKEYHEDIDDNLEDDVYWKQMKSICADIYGITKDGGVLYFMQREKNAPHIFKIFQETGWMFQNMIVWKKKTNPAPQKYRLGKRYQIIMVGTKGDRPNIFHSLSVNAPMPAHYKLKREHGLVLDDVWDDIREMTSGMFSGKEPILDANGKRAHLQQAPIHLLLRIILISTEVGDTIFDPYCGSGTSLIVAKQLKRRSIGIELAQKNIDIIKNRINEKRPIDSVDRFYNYYSCTPNMHLIWGKKEKKVDVMQWIKK